MVRHTSLVCQHLENISRQALEKYQHLIRQYIRNRHGVYAIYRCGKLYYVARRNSFARLATRCSSNATLRCDTTNPADCRYLLKSGARDRT
jgi:hypothetical protein